MNKCFVFIIGCALWNPLAFSAQLVDIYTYDILPPYAYRNDQGELTGVYIEIVKAAISRMPGYTYKFHVVPWKRAKISAQQGKAFAILPPYFHAHDWLTEDEPNRPYIWPYSLPLYTQQDTVICNSEKLEQREYTYPYDFEGLSFVMWRGDGRAGEAFEKMIVEQKIEVAYANTPEEAVHLLAYGRHDCTVTARLPFAWYMTQLIRTDEYQDRAKKKHISLKEVTIISRNEGYLGYSDINAEKSFPFKKDFTIKFDIEVYKMKRSGEINKIVNRFVDIELISNLPLER